MILPAGESCFVTSRASINQDVPVSLLEEVVIDCLLHSRLAGWSIRVCYWKPNVRAMAATPTTTKNIPSIGD